MKLENKGFSLKGKIIRYLLWSIVLTGTSKANAQVPKPIEDFLFAGCKYLQIKNPEHTEIDRYLRTALRYKKESQLPNANDSYYFFNDLGVFYFNKEFYQEALYYFKLTEADLSGLPLSASRCQVLRTACNYLGLIKKKTTDFETAKDFFFRSNDYAFKFDSIQTHNHQTVDLDKNRETFAVNFLNISTIYRWQKDFVTAQHFQNLARTNTGFHLDFDDHLNSTLLYGSPSPIHSLKTSLAYADSAVALAKNPKQQITIYQRNAIVLLQNDKLSLAKLAIQKAKSIQTDNSSGILFNKNLIIEADIFQAQKRYVQAKTAYEFAIENCIKKNIKGDQLNAALYGKFQMLVVQTKFSLALDTALELEKSISSLRQEYESEDSKLFLNANQRLFYEQAIQVCLRLKDLRNAFYFIEKSRAVLLMEHISEGSQAITPFQKIEVVAQKLSTQHQTFVSYFFGENKTFAFTIAGSIVKLQSLPISSKQREILISDYYSACNKRTKVPWYKRLWGIFCDLVGWEYNFFEEGHQLHEAIWKPLKVSENSDVVVSLDGKMFPFEAMLSENVFENKHYLLHKHTFSYTYSASFWLQATEKYGSPKMLTAILPTDFEKLPSLVRGESVVLSIQNKYQIQTLKGAIANKSQVELILRKNRGAVYFHTHAQADGLFAKLYLSNGEILTMKDISARQLGLDLVILTACQTAQGNSFSGEGVMSLARGFAYAGVPKVLASAWSIPELESSIISQRFLGDLDSPKRGLSNAKKTLVSSQEKPMLPFFWAGLMLTE